MSISELPAIVPDPPVKPWYSSKAWFAFAAGGAGVIAGTAFHVRSVSVTISVLSFVLASGIVAATGWGWLFAGYLDSRGLFSRKETP